MTLWQPDPLCEAGIGRATQSDLSEILIEHVELGYPKLIVDILCSNP